MNELFLVNGSFHTQDPAYPQATAVAIRDGRVWAVGSDEEIRALARPDAQVIDPGSAIVVPRKSLVGWQDPLLIFTSIASIIIAWKSLD